MLVYRQTEQGGPWVLRNPNDDLVFDTEFIDGGLPLTSLLQTVSYRLCAQSPSSDEIVDGPVVGFFERMPEPDYREARRMISAELTRLRTKPGIPCWLVPIRTDIPNQTTPGLNIHSGLISNACTFTSASTLRVQGAWQTWVQLLSTRAKEEKRPDGTGSRETVMTTARLPAYPTPRTGDLVILPGADDRYAVDTEITPMKFRGLVPLAFEVTLRLLDRNDPRYTLGLPPVNPRLAQPMYTPSV